MITILHHLSIHSLLIAQLNKMVRLINNVHTICILFSLTDVDILPLAIGHLISKDNEYWINYLRLLNIMDILFSPRVSKEDCSYLEALIYEHHYTLKLLYPHIHITPKLHYIVHMPRLILK